MIGADLAFERLHRSGLGAEGFVIPAFESGEPEQGPFSGNRMAPLFSGQFLELDLQLPAGGRRCQKRSDDAEAKLSPALVRPQEENRFFHRMLSFSFFPPLRRCDLGSTPTGWRLSPGILCGPKAFPHIAPSKGIEPVVIGDKNWSSFNSRSRRSTPKASHKACGKAFGSSGGEN